MGFSSFLGRVLFASIFILSAWKMFNEFGHDGGPVAKELPPKLVMIRNHLPASLVARVPDLDPRNVVAADIVLQGLGGFLFVFGSPFGAYLLLLHLGITTLFLYHSHASYQDEATQIAFPNEFFQGIAFSGALLFFIGMKNLLLRRQMKKKLNYDKFY